MEETTANTAYEMMVIILPDLGEEETKKELDEIKGLLAEQNANITHEDVWGNREFAYTIEKHDQGYYVVLNFEMDPSKLAELEKPMNLNQSILRYMVVKTPHNYQVKTLAEYEEEAEKAAAEEEKLKKEKEDAKKRPARKPVKKAEPKKAEPKKVEEKKEEPKKEVKEKTKIDDVDEKLKSIINDPDITL